MKKKIKCLHCGQAFIPNPWVKNHRYCSEAGCQRARKAKWKREKMAKDPDYKETQSKYYKQWKQARPGYDREYRRNHPEYVKRNRELQVERDKRRRQKAALARERNLAKVDAPNREKPIKTGIYSLVPWGKEGLAKVDAVMVKITEIERQSPVFCNLAKGYHAEI